MLGLTYQNARCHSFDPPREARILTRHQIHKTVNFLCLSNHCEQYCTVWTNCKILRNLNLMVHIAGNFIGMMWLHFHFHILISLFCPSLSLVKYKLTKTVPNIGAKRRRVCSYAGLSAASLSAKTTSSQRHHRLV
jgi:hypothetical protein